MEFKAIEAVDLRTDEKDIKESTLDNGHFIELLDFFETNDLTDFDLKISTIHRYIKENIKELASVVIDPNFFLLLSRPFQTLMSELIYQQSISITYEIIINLKEDNLLISHIPDDFILLLLQQLNENLNHITLGELLTILKTLYVTNSHFSELLYQNNIINLIWECKPTDWDLDRIYEQNIFIIITELIECLGEELDRVSLVNSIKRMVKYVNSKTVPTLLATSIECIHSIMDKHSETVIEVLIENLDDVYHVMRLNDHRVIISIMEFLWQVNSEYPGILDPREMIENMSVHLKVIDENSVSTVCATLKSLSYYMGNPEFYEMLINLGLVAQVASLLANKWPIQIRSEAALAMGNLLTMCDSLLALQIIREYAVIPSFIELAESEQQVIQIAVLGSLSRIAQLSLESGQTHILEAMADVDLKEVLDEILEMEVCVQSEYAERLTRILFPED